jgi:hypothetical protein
MAGRVRVEGLKERLQFFEIKYKIILYLIIKYLSTFTIPHPKSLPAASRG